MGLREGGEHAGRVRGGVHAHDEQRVGGLPVGEVAGALAGAERSLEGAAARLVAHVRAVRQVVRAELSGEELVQERRLVAEPSRRVEGRAVGAVELAEGMTDDLERVLPGDRHVPIGGGVVAERLGEAALVFELVIAPGGELGHRVGGEERGVDALGRHLPGDVLDAVLADVEAQALAIVGPRAPRAVEPPVLVVHPPDRPGALDELPVAEEHLRHARRRTPAGRRMVVRLRRRARLVSTFAHLGPPRLAAQHRGRGWHTAYRDDMKPTDALARALLSGLFLSAGAKTVRSPSGLAPKAEAVTAPIERLARQVPPPSSPSP